MGRSGVGFLRTLRADRTRGGQRMPGPRRPPHQRRSLPARDRRSRHRGAAGAGQGGRARPHRAHAGGPADAALPDGRPHQPQSRGLRLRAHLGAHGPCEGADRRHARHQGRQRVSLAGGGGALDDRGAGPPLSTGGGPDPGLSPPHRPRGAHRGPRGGLGGFDARGAEVAALAARVGERLRGHLGLNPEIAIVPPKTIPRSEGKAVRVVERR